MLRTVATIILALTLLLITGCDQIGDFGGTTNTKGPDIVRQADLGDSWQMAQLRLSVPAGEENSVLLRVKQNDQVDGYYYLEKGADIGFELSGSSVIYQSPGTSDRFSFVVTEGQVTTYTLSFSNPGQSVEVVFLEVIFPSDAELFFPLSTP